VRPALERTRSRRLALLVATMLASLACMSLSVQALAVVPAPGWTIHGITEPTELSAADDAACEAEPEGTPRRSTPCDSYRIVVTNAGSEPSSGPVTLSEALSSNVTPVYVEAKEEQPGGSTTEEVSCTTTPLSCTDTEPVPPGGILIMTINVTVSESRGTATNTTTAEGGGAPTVSATESTALGETPLSFGIYDLTQTALGADGAPDMQAGDHPDAFTTAFNFNNERIYKPNAIQQYVHGSPQDVRELVVDLPPGFVADPQASARCSLYALAIRTGITHCPKASEVGIVDIGEGQGGEFDLSEEGAATAIYSLVPEAGYPAEFGFTYLGLPILMYGSLVRTDAAPGGYTLQVRVPGLPNVALNSISVTFFGDPAQHDGEATPSAAYFTNPTDCSAGPLKTRVEADSWEEPQRWVSDEAVTYPDLSGCELLQFAPTIAVNPETTSADTPSGYVVEVAVPQFQNLAPVLATPELRNATVVLPAGVAASPSAANGLQGCSDAQIDLASLSPAACPPQSKIGTVKIVTPLLAEPLEGQVFLGEPECAPCNEEDAQDGRMLRLFVQAQGSGTLVKLEGRTSTSSSSGGQLTTSFANNPQLPFSSLRLTLNGGPWAPLANPQSCGTATTTSDLSPWSAPITPDATPISSFQVEGCANPPPFTPGFSAGATQASAGAYTHFTLTFSRADGQQDLSAIQVHTPPGLLGMLSAVTLCPEPQAASGTCGPQSLIGHSAVAAGAGPDPFWVGGEVFLTGPYDGAPFGLSVVTEAKAGPFDLGKVVVRAAINVDPNTSAITVTSGPLPQILDGVPLRIQTVAVTIDREGFMFNPTSCRAQEVSATVASAQGALAAVHTPFAASGCAKLPFKPTLTAVAGGQGSKADGTRFAVKVTSQGLGHADLAKVDLQLPKALSTRNETLQKACLQAVFEANPASCGGGSVIGNATVHTPILRNPLSGPAYLVSHGGAAFPDVEFVLQGEGVTLILDGKTDIKKGITYSRFESAPDAPFSTFESVFPTGPHSILTANVPESKNRNLCGEHLLMPTVLTAQNGAVLEQDTQIAIEGCHTVAAKPTRAQLLTRELRRCRNIHEHARVARKACEERARKRL
jgi:hypothetical protein